MVIIFYYQSSQLLLLYAKNPKTMAMKCPRNMQKYSPTGDLISEHAIIKTFSMLRKQSHWARVPKRLIYWLKMFIVDPCSYIYVSKLDINGLLCQGFGDP